MDFCRHRILGLRIYPWPLFRPWSRTYLTIVMRVLVWRVDDFGWSRAFLCIFPSIIQFQGRRNSMPSLSAMKGQLLLICWGVWGRLSFGFCLLLKISIRLCFMIETKLTFRLFGQLKGFLSDCLAAQFPMSDTFEMFHSFSPNSQGMRFSTPGVRHNEGQSDTAFAVPSGPQIVRTIHEFHCINISILTIFPWSPHIVCPFVWCSISH